jgi:hypothetical protein
MGYLRPMIIAAVAGLFMAAAGAFGTGAAPAPQRFAYWMTTMILSSVIGTGVFRPAYDRGWFERRPLVLAVAVSLVMAIPITLLVWFLGQQFFPRYMSTDPRQLPVLFQLVLLVSIIMTAVNYLAADAAMRRRQITHAASVGGAPVKFLERVPLKLRGAELYAVQAEDHYLRLHTARGSDLILMRLVDAVAELEGIEGAQTHRSWWVAKAAVTAAKRGDGRAVLTLKGGTEAPVSRSYSGALRQAGWF